METGAVAAFDPSTVRIHQQSDQIRSCPLTSLSNQSNREKKKEKRGRGYLEGCHPRPRSPGHLA